MSKNTDNGITVYIGGMWYHFESANTLIGVLDDACDDAGYEYEKDCVMEYDD